MQIHSEPAGVEGIVTASEKGEYNAGKHIPASGCSHSAIAGRIEVGLSRRTTYGCEMSLQDDENIIRGRNLTSLGKYSKRGILATHPQPHEFAGMRRENRVGRKLLHPAFVVGKNIQSVGIYE